MAGQPFGRVSGIHLRGERRPLAVDHEADGMVYFGYGFGGLSQSDAVAVEWPGTLKEGMCVRPGR